MILSGRPVNRGNVKTRNKGFTLIELMAVVTIISILAVVALAAYADYIVRSKVSEGMVFAAEAKTSVSEYYYNVKRIPENNTQAGLSDPDDYDNHKFIRRLEVTSVPKPGSITITFKIQGSDADGKELQLIPATIDGIMTWTCLPPVDNGIKVNQVPPNCRG
jgi:type IV pilus assembly protein PilA